MITLPGVTGGSLRITSPTGIVLKPGWQILEEKPAMSKLKLVDQHSSLDDIREFHPALRSGYFKYINEDSWLIHLDKDSLDLQGTSTHLLQFNGWALCMSQDFSPKRFLSAFNSSSTGQAPGRPALQPSVRTAFNRLFPDGRNGTPWKVVAADIASNLHMDTISVSTVQRALRQNAEKMKQ